MAKSIGFLGFGKIGQVIAADLQIDGAANILFAQDKFLTAAQCTPPPCFPLLDHLDEALLSQADLVVECALSDVLKQYAPLILKHCDLLAFSLTAFADADFYNTVCRLCEQYNTNIYLPHGAILGLDGISDAGVLLQSVTIETVKPPGVLARQDGRRTILYDGPTREACRLYARNVNVHAALALAGVGFDRMHSVIVSDPAAATNTHHIKVRGQGFAFELTVSSASGRSVTGAYTPKSACGSVRKALGCGGAVRFV